MKGTLVLIPGMMCDARLFAPQREALRDERRIVVADLSEGDSMDALVERVFEQAGARRFDVAGLSMGAAVALNMYAHDPGRIRRLAVLGGNHRADTPERSVRRSAQLRRVAAGRLRDVVVEEMKPAYLAECNGGDEVLRALLLDMAMGLGARTFTAQSTALGERIDRSATLQAARCPVLILCGAEDRVCPATLHREMADLCPSARLEILAHTGHISTLENPAAVNAALRAWLRAPVRSRAV